MTLDSIYPLHLGAQKFVIGHLKCDEIPKRLPVVKLFEVTELMHDQVVLELGRKMYDAIIEVEIAATRAASPPGLSVFDKDFVVREVIKGVEVREFCMHKRARRFAICRTHLFAMVTTLWSWHPKQYLKQCAHDYLS